MTISLLEIVGGVLGFSAPVTAAVYAGSFDSKNFGMYLGASLAVGLVSSIFGMHLAQRLRDDYQQQ